eukprot:3936318-Rhodomonas_salina.1
MGQRKQGGWRRGASAERVQGAGSAWLEFQGQGRRASRQPDSDSEAGGLGGAWVEQDADATPVPIQRARPRASEEAGGRTGGVHGAGSSRLGQERRACKGRTGFRGGGAKSSGNRKPISGESRSSL